MTIKGGIGQISVWRVFPEAKKLFINKNNFLAKINKKENLVAIIMQTLKETESHMDIIVVVTPFKGPISPSIPGGTLAQLLGKLCSAAFGRK